MKKKNWKSEKENRTTGTTLEESLREAERISNVLLSICLLIHGTYLLLSWFFSVVGVYGLDAPVFTVIFFCFFTLDLAVFLWVRITEGRKKCQKAILTVCVSVNVLMMNVIFGDSTTVYIVLLFVFSGYGSTRYTAAMSAVYCVMILVCTYFGEYFYWNHNIADLMYYKFPGEATLHYNGWIITNLADYMTAQDYALSVLLRRGTANVLALLVTAYFSIFLSKSNRRVLKEQHEADYNRAEAEAELSRNRAELAESKSRLLVSQIQPHFVFNVLNTIYHLCGMDSELAQSAVADFSDYLRANLNALKMNETVPFSIERQHMETYLRLEKTRFEDRLNVVWNIETENFNLPPLSIQPLIENAVKHGICRRSSGGTVTISTVECMKDYRVIVADDGVGFDPEQELDDTHVGLKNVRSRLAMMSHAELYVQSAPGVGTVVTIIIPKEKNDAYSRS